MEFYDVINTRKSIKSFKADAVDSKKIDKIIQATMMSPSWKNQTSYKIILVDNPSEKDNLAAAVENNDNNTTRAINEAPMVAVMVGNPALSGKVDEKDYYLVDSAIAMEHLVLAATAEGYGTCWVGSVDEDKVRDILGIPDNYRVVAMTPIGTIEEKQDHQPPKNPSDFVFHNKWQTPYKH
jgi:nitroreductase